MSEGNRKETQQPSGRYLTPSRYPIAFPCQTGFPTHILGNFLKAKNSLSPKDSCLLEGLQGIGHIVKHEGATLLEFPSPMEIQIPMSSAKTGMVS